MTENTLPTPAPEFTEEQINEARQYEATVREQAQNVIDGAVAAFTSDYGLSEVAALNEVAVQALTRSILLFGMLPHETQEILKNAPLIVAPERAG